MSEPNQPEATPPPTTSWRQEVPQRYRSTEVNEIARVLASLEPGAATPPSTKLMLASQFENKMFNDASSLADYRKKIQRRLKKMQKNYLKSVKVEVGKEVGGGNGIGEKSEREVSLQREEIGRLKRGMLERYRDKLRLIVENGHATSRVITDQHGVDKGERFSQHVDYALQWALDIGAVPDNGTVYKRNGTVVCWGTNWRSLDEEQSKLEKTAKDLESRLKNIWYYVLKATKIDMFVLERLKEVEEQLMHSSTAVVQPTMAAIDMTTKVDYQVASFQATRLLAIVAKENIDLVPPTSTPMQTSHQQLTLLRSVVPIPHTPQEEKEACLVYLDKIRAACQVLLIYVTLRPEDNLEGKNARMELKGSIEKAYQGAIDSFDFLAERYKEVDLRPKKGKGGGDTDVVLEDAWNKVMEYDKDAEMAETVEVGVATSVDVTTDTAPSVPPSPNRTRKRTFPLVMRSKVLFRRHRNPPSHLLTNLRNKGAEIHRDESPHAETTLVIKFGDAFVMTLHFSPLLVTVRALLPPTTGGVDERVCSRERVVFRETVVDAGLSSWKSPYAHLDAPVAADGGRPSSLRVMGISGTYPALAPLVSTRLSYASAQATRVLRRCFADVAGKAYSSMNSSEFEVELLEGTAVLKFVTKARSMYSPDWGKR